MPRTVAAICTMKRRTLFQCPRTGGYIRWFGALVLLVASLDGAWSFHPRVSSNRRQPTSGPAPCTSTADKTCSAISLRTSGNDDGPWLHHGLLFSSFNDGLRQNEQAQAFLRQGLVQALLYDERSEKESKVEASVLASPCNGPDINLLNDLSDVDARWAAWQDKAQDPLALLSSAASSTSQTPPILRLVYIPTALYALRLESNNTPGKQRQRARADGKKRRNQLVQWLQHQVMVTKSGDGSGHEGTTPLVNVCAVTVDLDDGSVKQPEGGSKNAKQKCNFPTTGQEALTSWKPHLVYVEGGNTFWLAYCVDKDKEWGHILTRVTTSPGTVYCGSSAGAILVGSCVGTATWKGWDDPRVVPDGRDTVAAWEQAHGLGLIPGQRSIFPHMDASWIDTVEQNKAALPIPGTVECLTEQAVLCVQGGNIDPDGTPICVLAPGVGEEATVSASQ